MPSKSCALISWNMQPLAAKANADAMNKNILMVAGITGLAAASLDAQCLVVVEVAD